MAIWKHSQGNLSFFNEQDPLEKNLKIIKRKNS